MATTAQELQPVVAGDIAREKIGAREKLAFAFVIFSNTPYTALLTTFLLIFYTDVVGLNPFTVGTLFLIARVVDGFSDPIMGYLVDRLPRTKFGKFRTVLIVGAILSGVNYILVWLGPALAPSGKLAIAYISYLVLGFTYDLPNIAQNSLIPVMTADDKARNTLGLIQGFVAVVGGAFFAILAPIILEAGNSSLSAYSTLILLVVGLVLLTSIIGALGVKERVMPVQAQTHVALKEYLNIFRQRPFYSYLAFLMLFTAAFFISSGVGAYFFTYVIDDLSMLGLISLLSLVGLLPGIFLSGIFSERLGKKKVLVLASVVMIFSLMIRWIDPTSIPLIFTSTILTGFLFGVFVPINAVMGADVVDYIEYKLNHRSEPAVASIASFASKFGSGMAAAIPGYVLGLAGYVANSQVQPPSVINAIIFTAVAAPIVVYAAAGLIFGFGYDLDKDLLQKVQTTLSERRAAKSVSQEQEIN
jgi:sugar (glycoside-pentoside-hexuronide) transporter